MPKKIEKTIIQAVENQLMQNTPSEVKETLNRIMATSQNTDYDEAVYKIAIVLSGEVYSSMKSLEEFDEKQYIEKLEEL